MEGIYLKAGVGKYCTAAALLEEEVERVEGRESGRDDTLISNRLDPRKNIDQQNNHA